MILPIGSIVYREVILSLIHFQGGDMGIFRTMFDFITAHEPRSDEEIRAEEERQRSEQDVQNAKDLEFSLTGRSAEGPQDMTSGGIYKGR